MSTHISAPGRFRNVHQAVLSEGLDGGERCSVRVSGAADRLPWSVTGHRREALWRNR
jgi:hypothetical protein